MKLQIGRIQMSKNLCHKKLFEVALPLESINKEASWQESIHSGHFSAPHFCGVLRPLANTLRVIIFQLGDDPPPG